MGIWVGFPLYAPRSQWQPGARDQFDYPLVIGTTYDEVGASTGTSTVAATSFLRQRVSGDGSTAGTSTVAATSVTRQIVSAQGAAAGTSSVDAHGAKVVLAAGAINCNSTVTATGRVVLSGVGSAVGTSTVTATGVDAGGPVTEFAHRKPNALLSATHLSGAFTDIDEDPNSPDGNWMLFAA